MLYEVITVPPVYISGVRVFDENLGFPGKVFNDETVVLENEQDYLELEFAALEVEAQLGLDP